jgi:hypothetical protein
MQRAPYHSPYWGNHHHDGYRHPHNHIVYVNSGWPIWGWGYPYGWGYSLPPIFPDDQDNYDSQTAANYAAPPPSDYNNGAYQAQPEDQQRSEPHEPYAQQPSRIPYGGAQSLPPASETPVTIVFKDDRPPEQIHNYLLTPNTLTVLDQHRHEIPVDQIDLTATARMNLQAGVEFSLPSTSY